MLTSRFAIALQRANFSSVTRSTIPPSFSRLIASIQPTASELQRAQSHVSTIKSRLAATFSLRRSFIGGSHARGSVIRGTSDIDLFAVIAQSDITRGGAYVGSNTVLTNLRDELIHIYSNT